SYAVAGRRQRSVVVDNVQFKIERGQTLGLIGESGSGKSTIARMLLRLLEPDSGSIRFDGVDLLTASHRQMQHLRRRMQIVFQDPYAALNPRMRIAQIVGEPLAIHAAEEAALRTRAAHRERISAMLCAVGLDTSALQRYPHEFSGGQRQRINIARALILQPEFVVLDEPVSALDVSVAAQIITLLQRLQREFQLTYLFITHSMPLVRYLADQIVVLQRGRVVEQGGWQQICEHPKSPYTQGLLAATPELPGVDGPDTDTNDGTGPAATAAPAS
ncbi:MAG TPA: ATP-binding cassette domain-containing protein, partial [Acidobacteriaceae bacterium]|nr:ATP-binding cassette domain-containing protein [Acidobacteriaceae bacterium]